jgi:Uma2 family endonuclease
MIEVGLLSEDDRLELIDGEIYTMPPTGPWHENAVDMLQRVLQAALIRLQAADQYRVRVQNAIILSEHLEMYPDVAIVREKAGGYGAAKPTATDTVLVIEVSDSMEDYDRTTKALRYALAGIPEYWLVSRSHATITVFTVPSTEGYKGTYIAKDETIECKRLKGLAISTTEVF